MCTGTKNVVEGFQAEVELCLKSLLEAEEEEEGGDATTTTSRGGRGGGGSLPLESKLNFFKKERRSLGQTALCLSGGGSICMYHIGIVKALFDAELFSSIRWVSEKGRVLI